MKTKLCYRFQVLLEIVLNGTFVADAAVASIQYTTLTAANHSAFIQTFKVNFRRVVDTPEMIEEGGYTQGQEIYALKGNSLAIIYLFVYYPVHFSRETIKSQKEAHKEEHEG